MYDIIIVCKSIFLIIVCEIYEIIRLFAAIQIICAFLAAIQTNVVFYLISVVSKPGDQCFYPYDSDEPVTIEGLEENMRRALRERDNYERTQKQMGIFQYYNTEVLPQMRVSEPFLLL